MRALFIFLTPLAFVLAGLEWRMRLVPTSYSLKREFLEQAAADSETLIFGTSHAFYNFNPEGFSRPGFNFANTSQSLVIDEQLFERYVNRFPHLKTVILDASYFSFEYRLYGEVDEFREYFYPRYYAITGDGGLWSRVDVRSFSQLATFGLEVAREVLLGRFTENHASEVSLRGWFDSSRSQEHHLPIDAEAGRGRAEFHTSVMQPRYTSANLAAVRQIVEIARARGVKVVLVQTPASPTYTRFLDPVALERYKANVAELNLAFFDYLKDARFRLDDFHDNDHLNSAGALKFSQIFEREVLASLDQGK